MILSRSEVSGLIASHEKAENFIAESVAVEFGLNDKSLVGKRIGNYKLLEIIGIGGMGTVFRAEKSGFEKNFAVKVIKRGMDTDAVLRRFELERQILSRSRTSEYCASARRRNDRRRFAVFRDGICRRLAADEVLRRKSIRHQRAFGIVSPNLCGGCLCASKFGRSPRFETVEYFGYKRRNAEIARFRHCQTAQF